MKRLRFNARTSIWLLVIIHTVGIVGLNSPFREIFRLLTPVNLLVTAIILLSHHEEWSRPFTYFCLFVLSGGYIVELIGTTTGNVFGHYFYGITLGPRLLGVPLIIGLNWLILIYSIGIYLTPMRAPRLLKIIGGALMMVLIDVFIEPVAMTYDFWQWESGTVPLLNYIGWFFTSSVFFLCFLRHKF